MKKIIVMMCSIFLFMPIVMGMDALAVKKGGNKVDFSVQIIDTANKNIPYYDLSVKPGETKKIKMKVFNRSGKDIKIKTDIFTASTSNKGQIVYTQKSPKPDESMKNSLSDFTKIQLDGEYIEVKSKSNKVITAVVKVPKNASGVMLGSWYFEKAGADKNENKEPAINSVNNYSYAVAIKLRVSEISDPNINLLGVEASLDNYRKVINLHIQNNRPAIMSKMRIRSKIMKKGEKDVLFQRTEKDLMFAPNTNFQFPVSLEDKILQAGKYVAHVEIISNDPKWSQKKWTYEKEFEVTEKEAITLSKEAINDDKQQSAWVKIVLIVVGIALVGLAGWFVYRHNKMKKKK